MTMPSYHITIMDKIKTYRNENNLSLREFGKLIGVSAQAVYKWEQNTCYPDIIFLPHLACVLECITNDFFEIISQTPNLLPQNCVYLLEHGGDNKNEQTKIGFQIDRLLLESHL